ncbi:inorganic phosphate transporter [Candidatus Micrarchaeota archaeon]|nr:inorganic phosphate transporter [Candidatus Micrarchaeota archaeon]MBU1166397.1 inorganic phosphate transporter [Candidatus Micrarchaeota archaeon]MBU1887171.1 inorganic phosphate transporter [Candidatus Micrarchaeota archaeon]
MIELLVLTILMALGFDFLNGFHDSANAISTVVATRVLTPMQAVSMAAIGNLIGPLFFTTAIAATIGKEIIDTKAIQILLPQDTFIVMILAALVGAIIWNILTWFFGIPVSSSHALIGGLIGAATVAVGPQVLLWDGINKVLIFIVVSPILGFVVAFLFGLIVMGILKKSAPAKVNFWFKKLQILSAFFYSVTHGTNDAQKTMGIITILLVVGGFLTEFEIPLWVVLMCHIAICLGTWLGGWRIVKTMAHKITQLKPYQGFCAETAGGVVLIQMANMGVPVSTTHAIAGAIMGVGSTKNPKSVRWGLSRNIILAWFITIPFSAVVSAGIYFIIHSFL